MKRKRKGRLTMPKKKSKLRGARTVPPTEAEWGELVHTKRVRRPNERNPQRTIDVSVLDDVILYSAEDDHNVWIGQVHDMGFRENEIGDPEQRVWIKIRWYYSGFDVFREATSEQYASALSSFAPRERVLSDVIDILDFVCIKRRAYVHPWIESNLENFMPAIGPRDFFMRAHYDASLTLLLPDPHEIDCPTCKRWYNPFPPAQKRKQPSDLPKPSIRIKLPSRPAATLTWQERDSMYSSTPDPPTSPTIVTPPSPPTSISISNTSPSPSSSDIMHFCPRPQCRRWYHRTCLERHSQEIPGDAYIGPRSVRFLAVDPDSEEPHPEFEKYIYLKPARGKMALSASQLEREEGGGAPWEQTLEKIVKTLGDSVCVGGGSGDDRDNRNSTPQTEWSGRMEDLEGGSRSSSQHPLPSRRGGDWLGEAILQMAMQPILRAPFPVRVPNSSRARIAADSGDDNSDDDASVDDVEMDAGEDEGDSQREDEEGPTFATAGNVNDVVLARRLVFQALEGWHDVLEEIERRRSVFAPSPSVANPFAQRQQDQSRRGSTLPLPRSASTAMALPRPNVDISRNSDSNEGTTRDQRSVSKFSHTPCPHLSSVTTPSPFTNSVPPEGTQTPAPGTALVAGNDSDGRSPSSSPSPSPLSPTPSASPLLSSPDSPTQNISTLIKDPRKLESEIDSLLSEIRILATPNVSYWANAVERLKKIADKDGKTGGIGWAANAPAVVCPGCGGAI